MKFLRLLLRCYFVGKPEGVLWNVSCFLLCFRCGTQKNAMWYKIGTNYPLKHQVRCRVVNYAITKRSLKSHSVQKCLSPCPADGALLTESCLIFSAYLEQASGSQFSFCLQESELKIHTALWLYLPVHTQTTIARQRQTTWNRQIFIWNTLQNFFPIYDFLRKCRGSGEKYERVVKYNVYLKRTLLYACRHWYKVRFL